MIQNIFKLLMTLFTGGFLSLPANASSIYAYDHCEIGTRSLGYHLVLQTGPIFFAPTSVEVHEDFPAKNYFVSAYNDDLQVSDGPVVREYKPGTHSTGDSHFDLKIDKTTCVSGTGGSTCQSTLQADEINGGRPVQLPCTINIEPTNPHEPGECNHPHCH